MNKIYALLVVLVIFGLVTISHIGAPNKGQHTGYVTSVEQNGIIWKTWRAYVKTDPQSSQEDEYCIKDPQIITQLQKAELSRGLITLNYSAPVLIFKWNCAGEDSIIRSLSTTVKQCTALGNMDNINIEMKECFDNLSMEEFLSLLDDKASMDLYQKVKDHYDTRTDAQKAADAKEVESYYQGYKLPN